MSTEPSCVPINTLPSLPHAAHVVCVEPVALTALNGVVETDFEVPVSPKIAEECVAAKNVELMIVEGRQAATNKHVTKAEFPSRAY